MRGVADVVAGEPALRCSRLLSGRLGGDPRQEPQGVVATQAPGHQVLRSPDRLPGDPRATKQIPPITREIPYSARNLTKWSQADSNR